MEASLEPLLVASKEAFWGSKVPAGELMQVIAQHCPGVYDAWIRSLDLLVVADLQRAVTIPRQLHVLTSDQQDVPDGSGILPELPEHWSSHLLHRHEALTAKQWSGYLLIGFYLTGLNSLKVRMTYRSSPRAAPPRRVAS